MGEDIRLKSKAGEIGAYLATPKGTAKGGVVVIQEIFGVNHHIKAVTDKFASQHDVKTLSDLAKACGPLVLAGPAECPDRPFCQQGLEKTYGLEFSDFKSYDFGLIDQAILKGDASIGLVLSSDGALAP